ncbi:hypothetical protein V6N13_102220 [Hibiscus sabdariffa]
MLGKTSRENMVWPQRGVPVNTSSLRARLKKGDRYLPNVDDTSADNYCSFAMAAGKSGSCKMLESFEPPPSKKSRKERNQEKLHFSTDKPEVEVLDQDIWKEFPEDLFEAVIARLPIATFFCFRSVCCKWNSLLDSQTFAQRCAEIPQRNPWFYAFTHDNGNVGSMCYDPSMRKWHHPTFKRAKPLLIRLHLLVVWFVFLTLVIGNSMSAIL